ncbi:hypothetical protein CK203_018355 [Vitis vinifera]|uniref:Uncharacterized protein n=1 Tax=Vitis vinifera TaxID=29760 RepID=A0A438JPD8_VITVI|nr:hypothetical protein CK203_018355 [Vitis vinifera]
MKSKKELQSLPVPLSESRDWRPSINGLNFKVLGEGLANSLEVMFSEEEIFAALSSCCGDKAPGSDDFTMTFCPRWDLGIDGLTGWNGVALQLPSRSPSMGALWVSFVALRD